jgi:hypothetical protein
MEQIITAAEAEQHLPTQERAIQITQRIKANGAIAANAIVEIGKDLRTVKIEELYKELGYESFENYAKQEFNLEKRQAQTYISTFEKLGEEFMQANAQLGITRLAMLATANPEDRAEVMESTDVAHITTRELEQLLAEKKQQGEQLSLLQEENTKLEARVEELESAPKDVEVAEKEVIKEVPDPKTVKQLAEAEAALKEAKKELSATAAEAELYKKSAESARIEAKKVKDNAEREAEKAAKAEIEKFQKVTDERIRKAEQEKAALEAKVAELQKVAEKPPENADKSNFKVMLSTVYRDMLGLVEFINNTEDIADRKQYFKKALEILHVCEDSIKERVEIPAEIPKQSLTSRGVVDIGSMKPISSSSNVDYDDYDYDDEEKDDDE